MEPLSGGASPEPPPHYREYPPPPGQIHQNIDPGNPGSTECQLIYLCEIKHDHKIEVEVGKFNCIVLFSPLFLFNIPKNIMNESSISKKLENLVLFVAMAEGFAPFSIIEEHCSVVKNRLYL